MKKLLPSDFVKKLIVSFPPLSIEPVYEGYRLVSDPPRQRVIDLIQKSTWLKGGGGGTLIVVAFFFLFSPITWHLLSNLWPFLSPVAIFAVVYGSLKLIFDPQFRYGVGAKLGLAPAEIIFSHYPLRVVEDDRLTFRRQLKDNIWTQWFRVNHFPDQGRLQVSLLCAERVTYTEGTDTITEVAIVHEEQIYAHSLIGGDRQVKAYFNFHIPKQLPPSFEGKNNQIRWLLKVEEKYPQVIGQHTSYLTFMVDP